ncbi:MAG: DUF2784 domain-containing protein [Gammaproteobacteria bacterium]|jgi:hypothetical protein
MYAFLADSIVVLHLLFILFVVSGGFLALKWLKVVYLHIPAVVWGVYIEFSGKICPLTPLENWFRLKSGQMGYEGDFIERYIIPIIYPVNLTRDMQFTLGATALLINLLAYSLLVLQLKKRLRE